MKPFRPKPVLLVCLVLLAAMLGCIRKKQVTAVPPQPSAAPAATPTPQPESRSKDLPVQTQTQPPAQGTPPPGPDQDQSPPPEKAKAKNGKTHLGKKQAPGNEKSVETARNVPPKTIVKSETTEPSTTTGRILPDPSQGAPHDKATTEQLLQSTETNLAGIKRQLSQEDEATVSKIRDFVGQSRKALDAKDYAGAQKLAEKAHLLCDELMKRR